MPTPTPPPTPDAATHGLRAALLRFDADGRPLYDEDGLLAIGPGPDGVQRVVAAGDWRALSQRFPGLPVTHRPGRIIAPGFVDMHVHFPQTDVIGSPAEGLLPWLENYTFPHESRFCDPDYARGVAAVFIDELLRNGVTTALTFATSHPASVDALMEEAAARGLRLIAGKVLQDRNSPTACATRPPGRSPTPKTSSAAGTAGAAWATRSPRVSLPAAARRNCAGRANWRPDTPTCGSSRTWPRTATRSAGRSSSFPRRAATLRCTTASA